MTPQQQEVLDFIREQIETTGSAPTYNELQVHFRWKSRSAAYRVVSHLVRAGELVRRPFERCGLSLPGRPRLTGVPSGVLIAEILRRGDLEPPAAIARFTEAGELQLGIYGEGPVRFLVVDERSPHDRVYEITTRLPIEDLDRLIPPDSPIGSKDDDRHSAMIGVLKAAAEGRQHLRSVE